MINTQNKEGNPLLLQWQSHFAPQNKEDYMLDKMIGFIGAGMAGKRHDRRYSGCIFR